MQITRVTEPMYTVKLKYNIGPEETVFHCNVTLLQIRYLQLEMIKSRAGLITKYEYIDAYITNSESDEDLPYEWVKVLDDGSLSNYLPGMNCHEEILLEELKLNHHLNKKKEA